MASLLVSYEIETTLTDLMIGVEDGGKSEKASVLHNYLLISEI